MAVRDVGDDADPAERRRSSRCCRGAHQGLRTLPGVHRPVHVRGQRGHGLLAAGRQAGAGVGLHARSLDRDGAEPVVERRDRRSAPGLRRRDHDRDRWLGRRPVQQARGRRTRLRDGPAGGRAAQGLQHEPGPAGSSARLSAAGDVVHVDEPGRATVRRRAGAQGRELRLRQGGRPAARRRTVGGHERGAHLPRRAAQQPAGRLRPVRVAGGQRRHRGGEAGDVDVEVRHRR